MYELITFDYLNHIDSCSVNGLCRYILKAAPYITDWPISGKHFPDILRYTNRHDRNRQYHLFDIPKKSGGVRQIVAPVGDLKSIQTVLAYLLSSATNPDEHAHGFIREHSVITNASQHLRKAYVLNLDLKDFFPGITFRQVESALRKYFSKEVSTFIAKLCTWTDVEQGPTEDVLPQGAPTSPVLSNIVCETMDSRLSGLARRFGLTYSRYADDITFSSFHSVYAKDSVFWAELHSIIEECGFQLNDRKTRLLKRGTRQEVTGITVEDRLNVSRKWMKLLRTQVFHYEMYGGSEEIYRSLMGKIAFLKMVRGSGDERACKLYSRVRHYHHAVPMMEQHWSGEPGSSRLASTMGFNDFPDNESGFFSDSDF